VSLVLLAAGSSFEFRWRRWALLRDCLAHHLEAGRPGSVFPAIASLGDALVEGRIEVDPRILGAELRAARDRLRGIDANALMIGPETAAVLYLGTRAGAPRPLTQVERKNIPGASEPARDLADHFTPFFDSAIAVCDHAEAAGKPIEVLDI
jgi:hypothetical protein